MRTNQEYKDEQDFKDSIKEQLNTFTDAVFEVVYDEAWQRGHRSGYSEVKSEFIDLQIFVEKIISLI